MEQTPKPSGDPLLTSDLQMQLEQMYIRTEHWILDFAFFEDEMKFLINLVDKYFITLLVSDTARVNLIKETAKKLIVLDNQRESLARENKQNLEYLARILKNEVAFDPEEFKDTQSDLETDQVGFMKHYRSLKREIFELAGHINKLSRAGYLLRD